MKRWLALALLMLVSGLAGWWSADWKPQRVQGHPSQTVYLLDNGYHTDLAVPVSVLLARDDALARAVRQTTALYPDARWVLIGWGEQNFFQGSGPIRERLPEGARALFTPGGSPAVLQLIALQAAPGQMWADEAYGAALDDTGMARLRGRIARSLATRSDDTPIRTTVSQAYRPRDTMYFASRERFSVFKLCNHWMAEVLYAGGLEMPVGRALLSSEVVKAVSVHNEGRTGLERPQ
ncbi:MULTISPECIES: DUF2459 domain-containing protein [unclassified Brevundimonas]|uniref:DUF2459 domain-containing protein n=1 Tax=unclassified Brevundimonas TaxID=2622653 RepID=UPI0025BEDC46|nr:MULTISPECIES: DUF2459 domain-containing protein [unclassified Brevundimonas]